MLQQLVNFLFALKILSDFFCNKILFKFFAFSVACTRTSTSYKGNNSYKQVWNCAKGLFTKGFGYTQILRLLQITMNQYLSCHGYIPKISVYIKNA